MLYFKLSCANCFLHFTHVQAKNERDLTAQYIKQVLRGCVCVEVGQCPPLGSSCTSPPPPPPVLLITVPPFPLQSAYTSSALQQLSVAS